MLQVFSEIKNVKEIWGKINLSNFLNIHFLQAYYEKNKQVKHLFILNQNMRLYAHIFKLNFSKAKNYLPKNPVINIFLNLIKFNVLYLTNSYITNVPAFKSSKTINLSQLIYVIKYSYSMIVIPDFLFSNMIVKDNNYQKIEVEEEMCLDIRTNWNKLEDYMSDLKMKYRKKIKKIIINTNGLKRCKLESNQLTFFSKDIKSLFLQIADSSQFKGPEFNTDTLILLEKKGFININGYFLNDKLVGFSSEIESNNILYSYFVGFDKKLNKTLPIYARIILDNISNSINRKNAKLILGRTANEFKSNFGALPVKSFIYIKIQNIFLRIIMRPIIKKLTIKKWTQRNPFKN